MLSGHREVLPQTVQQRETLGGEAGPPERRGRYVPSSDCTVFRGNYCLKPKVQQVAQAKPSVPLQRPRFVNNRYAVLPNPRSGGMAFVYKASDMLDDNRQVAIKMLRGTNKMSLGIANVNRSSRKPT